MEPLVFETDALFGPGQAILDTRRLSSLCGRVSPVEVTTSIAHDRQYIILFILPNTTSNFHTLVHYKITTKLKLMIGDQSVGKFPSTLYHGGFYCIKFAESPTRAIYLLYVQSCVSW